MARVAHRRGVRIVIHMLVMHVTVLLIVAFFILFAASKAEGIVGLLGNILGIWVVLVALLHIVGFFVPGMMGMKPGMMPHGHWMHHWGQDSTQPAPAAPAAAPAPTAPPPKKP
jgi:hypothetical protein